MKKNNLIFGLLSFVLTLLVQIIHAQDSLPLSKPVFLEIVRKYHPVAKQSGLFHQLAAADVLAQRGAFDPVIAAKTGSKTLDNTRYYQSSEAMVTIPTWYGVDFEGEYSNLAGDKLNNGDTKGELYRLGINVPIGRDLLTDKRRTALQQAQIMQQMTSVEQLLFVNELLLDAESAYIQWQAAYRTLQIQLDAVEYNRNRLRLTIQAFQNGERAAIDTTEAAAQLQSFELQALEAKQKLDVAVAELQGYLFTENAAMFANTAALVPETFVQDETAAALLLQAKQAVLAQFAGLQYYFFKQNFLEADRRLKQQNLLPKITFQYNFLNRNFGLQPWPLFDNNYQYGLSFKMPLLLRRERGELAMAKLKLRINEQDQLLKEQELKVKIVQYDSTVANIGNQIRSAETAVALYARLLQAEETKFFNGESSLFLINSRETKLIEAQQKLIELQLKYEQTVAKIRWMVAGINSIQ